jgi:DNA topoisomerase-1
MCKQEMRAATEAERKALGVPPAYTNVMVSIDAKADLIATARIPNGKTFYKYSQAFIEGQAAKKWDRVKKLGAKVERIEARIERDCETGSSEAMCAKLILLTGMRNGGEPQGKGESFGASSLQVRHARVVGSTIVLDFIGKKGVPQHYEVRNADLAAYFAKRMSGAKGGDAIFQHDAHSTLRYLKSIGAQKVHDLRTWRANEIASALVTELLKNGMPEGKKAIKAFQKAVAVKVAEVLGNSPSQAMKSYIDPRVWSSIE